MYWRTKLNEDHTGLTPWLTVDEMNYLRRRLRRLSTSIDRAVQWRVTRNKVHEGALLDEAINRLTILTGP